MKKVALACVVLTAMFSSCTKEKPVVTKDPEGRLVVTLPRGEPGDEITVDRGQVYSLAEAQGLLSVTDQNRCGGGGSCSVNCNGVTYNFTGFSNLCHCEEGPGWVKLECTPEECPDIIIYCTES